MGANRLIRVGAARRAMLEHRPSAAGAPEGPICLDLWPDYFAPWRRCEKLMMRQHHCEFRAKYLLS